MHVFCMREKSANVRLEEMNIYTHRNKEKQDDLHSKKHTQFIFFCVWYGGRGGKGGVRTPLACEIFFGLYIFLQIYTTRVFNIYFQRKLLTTDMHTEGGSVCVSGSALATLPHRRK
jgi:hypothetical protein